MACQNPGDRLGTSKHCPADQLPRFTCCPVVPLTTVAWLCSALHSEESRGVQHAPPPPPATSIAALSHLLPAGVLDAGRQAHHLLKEDFTRRLRAARNKQTTTFCCETVTYLNTHRLQHQLQTLAGPLSACYCCGAQERASCAVRHRPCARSTEKRTPYA